jgi:hypothetical protein
VYCTTCGSFSSGGEHRCDVPAAEPQLAAVGAAVGVDAASVAATPPGWHRDPANAAQLRYWDGSRWTDHVAASGPQEWPGFGRLVGVVPSTVGKRGRFDVVVYEDAILFAKVPGTDLASVGGLIGLFTVGVVLGYVIGDYVGASRNRERIAQLAAADPREILNRDRKNDAVPIGSLVSGKAVIWGRSGGRLDLRTVTGGRYKRRWTRPHTRDLEIEPMLARAIGTRGPVRRGSSLRPYLALVAMLAFVALILLAIAIPTFLGARDAASDRAELRSMLGAPCQRLYDLDARAAEGVEPSFQEVDAVVDELVIGFDRAIAVSTDYVEAKGAATRIDQALASASSGTPGAGPDTADYNLVFGACSTVVG